MTNPTPTSIREVQSVARLSHTFSRSLSAVDLVEPLASLDEDQPVSNAKRLMEERHFSVLGVRRAGLVAGWVALDDLTSGNVGTLLRSFRPDDLLEETASIDVVLGAFATREHVFIRWRGEVAGVITRQDLQKPPLRMWLFGAITVLDANLSWAMAELFPNDSWRSRITVGRWEKAVMLQAERQRRGSDCTLIDCLQIKDKADIMVEDRATLKLLGISSRREADRLTRDIEKLRNYLAHGQMLEREHFATATRIASSIHTILGAEVAQSVVAARHAHSNDSLKDQPA